MIRFFLRQHQVPCPYWCRDVALVRLPDLVVLASVSRQHAQVLDHVIHGPVPGGPQKHALRWQPVSPPPANLHVPMDLLKDVGRAFGHSHQMDETIAVL